MKEQPTQSLPDCPKCGKSLDASWMVCPYCGLRLKLTESVVVRAIIWSLVIFAFVSVDIVLSRSDDGFATWFSILVGLPLAYTFGKALIFRLRGKPLTFSQLGIVSIRVAFYTFIVTVVAPVVLGVALILCFLAICMSGGFFSGGTH